MPPKTNSRRQTKKQSFASQRNWTRYFLLKYVMLWWPNGGFHYSVETVAQQDKVNKEIDKLRKLVDKDWQNAKDKLED